MPRSFPFETMTGAKRTPSPPEMRTDFHSPKSIGDTLHGRWACPYMATAMEHAEGSSIEWSPKSFLDFGARWMIQNVSQTSPIGFRQMFSELACSRLNAFEMDDARAPITRRSNHPSGLADTSCRRRSNRHSSRRGAVSTPLRIPCSHKNTGKRPSASCRWIDVRNEDRSAWRTVQNHRSSQVQPL